MGWEGRGNKKEDFTTLHNTILQQPKAQTLKWELPGQEQELRENNVMGSGLFRPPCAPSPLPPSPTLPPHYVPSFDSSTFHSSENITKVAKIAQFRYIKIQPETITSL